MSRLADRRYTQEEWEDFRKMIDAWCTLGGLSALSIKYMVTRGTIKKWRLGVTTPARRVRDDIMKWMRARVQGMVQGGHF